MIEFSCQKCGQAMKAALEHAGKQTRCPGCQGLVRIPLMAAAPLQPALQPAPPPVMEVLAAETPAPRRRPRDDDDENDYEDDALPRRRRRREKAGRWADCPKCGCPGHATRVHWTWWGGLIGPAIINTVRCHDCATSYNGNSGQYNTAAIAIYFAVTFVMAIGIFIVLGLLGIL